MGYVLISDAFPRLVGGEFTSVGKAEVVVCASATFAAVAMAKSDKVE